MSCVCVQFPLERACDAHAVPRRQWALDAHWLSGKRCARCGHCGQGGRWAEVPRLLQFGLDVLLCDSDVGWFQNPVPYLREVEAATKAVDMDVPSILRKQDQQAAEKERQRKASELAEVNLLYYLLRRC